MKKFEINLQNIAENDGLEVSVTGMTIVFLGLVVVSAFIALLPGLLDFLDRLRARKDGALSDGEDGSEEKIDAEIAAAIAMVLEHAMTPEDGSAFQRITIRRSAGDSAWKQAGHLRSLSTQAPMRKDRR